jgi:TnpA family transposase
MPRRELLTPTERLQLLAFPEDTGELIRVLTLSKLDVAFVRQHRGDHNRFGIAVLMAYLRYPGRILAKDEKPHDPVLNLIAEQLQIPTAAWELYADRDETRREHLAELLSLLDIKQFSTRHYRALSEWLEPTAFADHARNGPGTGSCGRTTKAAHCSAASGCHRTPLC